MSPDTRNLITRLLQNEAANVHDDLARATRSAQGRDPNGPWGKSGQTIQQVIDFWQAYHEKVKAAVAEFKALNG